MRLPQGGPSGLEVYAIIENNLDPTLSRHPAWRYSVEQHLKLHAAIGLIRLPALRSTWLSSQFFWRFNQNAGLAPNAHESLTAISALMPRLPRTISLIVLLRTPMCSAN